MDKFRDVVMKLSENETPELKSLIQEHLTNFISDFHTPDHPPYAAMIHKAIEELNGKRGSSEESISQFIKKQHTDLPLAHNSLLKHHLGKLCDSGEIVVTDKHLYLLPGTNPTLESFVRTEKDKLKRKKRKRNGRRRVGKKDQMESDKHGEKVDRCNKEKVMLIGEHNEMDVDYKVDKVVELNQVDKQTERQEKVMIDEKSQLHIQQSHAIGAPVVDSNQPERPPGFEFVKFQSEQKDLIELEEPEMVFNSERPSEPEILQQVDQEQRRRGQLNCEFQSLPECPKSASSDILTGLLPSQYQQQLDLSNSEALHVVKLNNVKFMERYPQKLKQYGRRKKLKSQTKEKETQDVTAELEQIVQTKQLDLSDLDKSSQSFPAECRQQFEFCEEKQTPEFELCGGKQAPESKKQALTFNDVDMDTKQQHIVEQHDKSVSRSPIEQQGTNKIDQVVRRSQRLSKSKQACTSSLDLLPSSQLKYHYLGQLELQNDQSSLQVEESPQPKMAINYYNLAQKLQQMQLPAEDCTQTTKQTVMESSEFSPAQVQMDKTNKVLQPRAKLRSWQKWSTSQANIQSSHLSSSLALGRTEKVQQEPLQIEFYQQPVVCKELSTQQQVQGKVLGKNELEAATSTMDLSPSCQRRPQVHWGRERPPKPLSPLRHQHDRLHPPAYRGRGRGRGRPPRMKLGQVNANS